MSGSVRQAGQQAENSAWLDHAVRAGLVAYGVVHLMIAFLAIRLALGTSTGAPSQKGALADLARQPFGRALVWAIAIGMFLLVVWRLLDAGFGNHDKEGGDRLKARLASVGKAIVYAVLGVTALKTAVGSQGGGGGKSGSGTKGMTATVLNWPGGQVIIVVVGLAIIGYGGYMAYRGWAEKFREHLDAEGESGETGTAYVLFGKVGYLAKGVAIAIVGALFVYAGATHKANKSGGLDQALHKVLQQPFGQVLLILIGVGIGCYGLFCFARARHLSR